MKHNTQFMNIYIVQLAGFSKRLNVLSTEKRPQMPEFQKY